MPIPQELELLSQQLDALLGSQYQALSAAFHALQNKEGHPALEKDEHRTHLATLSSLIHAKDPSLISESVMAVVRECLPSYHFQYEGAREASIRLAVEKVATAIAYVSSSHWSQRNLALKELTAIQQGYEAALSAVDRIQTRVPVAILEEGYYSLDVATARCLLCIDDKGEESRENSSGARAVYAANGIHYKPDPSVVIGGQYRDIAPIAPEKEYAVSSLIQYVGNQLAAAPTGLLIIKDVPLDRADAHRTTGGLVQAGLSIEGMCFREFLSLREALRFFKRTIGEGALIRILEDERQGYSEFLALARAEFPEVFTETPGLTEPERAARAASFRRCFDRISENMDIVDCFEEIQEANSPKISESKKAFIFRGMYEKCAHNLSDLQILVALARTYPELMAGQSILSSIELLKFLPILFKLFPKQSAAFAIEEIERVLTHYLDKEATSALWVGLLLSLPQDAKLDNFRLQLIHDKEGNLERCRIVSIDNDLSLGMPFMQVIWEQFDTPRLGVTIKNSLYWLPELLEQPIDPQVRTRLLASPARSQWLTWLCLVARRNQEHAAWQQQGVLSQNEAARLLMKLPERVLKFILAQWEKLQTVLRADPEMTHAALLNALYPTVVAAYDAIGQEIRAQKKDANIQDYDVIVNQTCASYGYYLLSIEPKEGIAEHEGEICRAYEQDFSGRQQEVLPQGMVEISQFVLKLLRAENWSNHTELEQWFLLQAYSLLPQSTRLDWEECMPLGQQQALWQSWLVAAIAKGSLFMVTRLLHLGANVALPMDKSLKTPLHYFCEGYLTYPDLNTVQAMAEILLSHHSSQPNAYDAMGYTPLFYWANLKKPAILGDEMTAMAEKVFILLCAHGADVNLLDGQTSCSLLDKMVKTDNAEWFIFLVKYGVRECKEMQAAVKWCHHCSLPDMVPILHHLQKHSLIWTWWLGLPQWQQEEGGRPVKSIMPELFSLPLPLWRVWAQSAIDLEVSEVELIKAGVVVTAEATEHSRRAVKAVQYGNLRLHIKLRAEMPAVEFAVYTFLNRLFGELVAPSSCLSIVHEEEVHLALFSQTVPGQTLFKVMQEDNFQQGLNKRQTSAQILGAMLVHPEDGKANNHMVMPKLSEQGKIENHIIAIDNDHAFVNAVAKDGTLLVKSVLFCLELMREPVHSVWRDRILGLSAEFFLREWLKEVENYQTKAHAVFDKDARKALLDVSFFDFVKLPVVITFPLYEEAVIALWDRFTKLQEILRRAPTITHLALLKQLDPVLGGLYGKAFEDFPLPENVEERFDLLCAKSYGKKGQTLSTTVEVQKAMQLPEKQRKAIATQNDALLFTPTDALETLDALSKEALHKTAILNELYDTGESRLLIKLKSKTLQMQIVNEIDFMLYVNKNKSNENGPWDIAKQRRTLRCIAEARIPFTRLAIAHCAGLTVNHLKAILAVSKGLAYLKLVDCPNVTNELFGILSQYDKNLMALTLVQCHGLTESKWGFFEPTFLDLERVRIEDNPQLEKINLRAPRLKRLKISKNKALRALNMNGDEPLQRDGLGRTPLLQAVASGNIERLEHLILHYSDLNLLEHRDNEGNTSFLLAVKREQLAMVKHLLTHYSEQISPTEEDSAGKTVIMLAREIGKEKILWPLLKKYPELRRKDLEHNTLLSAAANGDIDSFINLVSMDPTQLSLKARDEEGRSAVLLAAENGRIAMVDYLLENHPKHFSLLQSDYKGNTPFDLSKGKGKGELYNHLTQEYSEQYKKSKKTRREKDSGFYYFRMGFNDPIFDKLISTARISLWERNSKGRTGLMVAALYGRVKCVDHLCMHYPEQILFTDKDFGGHTLLLCAVLSGNKKMVKHLLLNYPNQVSLSDKDNDGNTPLLCAIKGEVILSAVASGTIIFDKRKLVRYLLSQHSKQVSLVERNNAGENALILAAKQGDKTMVEYLLSAYPDRVSLADKDYQGRSALMLAKENGKEEMYAYLLEKEREQRSAPMAPIPQRLSSTPLAFNAAPRVSASSSHIEASMDEVPVVEGDEINKAARGLSR